MRTRWTLLLVVLLLSAAAALAWAEDKTTPIASDQPLVDKEQMAGTYPQVGVAAAWPTEKEWKEKGAPSTPDLPYTLDKILLPEVMPEGIKDKLRFIKGFPVPIRNVRLGRWQYGQYQIQVAEQPPATIVLVKDTKATPKNDMETMQGLFRRVVGDLFQHSKEINAIPFQPTPTDMKPKHSMSFMVTEVRQAVPEKVRAEWYGRLDWWSDGQTVIIWVPRWETGPGMQRMQPMNMPVKTEVVGPDGKPVTPPANKPAPGPVAPSK